MVVSEKLHSVQRGKLGRQDLVVRRHRCRRPFPEFRPDRPFKRVPAVLRAWRALVRICTDDITRLGQARARGEPVTAMTWNASASRLRAQGIPVACAQPKKGALTRVCGAALLRDERKPRRAHPIVESRLSVETVELTMDVKCVGHARRRAHGRFDDRPWLCLALAGTGPRC